MSELGKGACYKTAAITYRHKKARRRVYAIALCEDRGGIVTISAVYALTSDKRAVQALVKLCNELELSPVHLKDVAEDFIYENRHKKTEC